MIKPSPWLLGHGAQLEAAKAKCEGAGLSPRAFEVLDPSSQAFFALVNAANQVAFGGLGMPAWVQLDCCTLPGLMVGWGGGPEQIADALRREIMAKQGATGELDFWPYSEFCGIRRGDDALVGISTFSLVPRQGLGLRAKALGLWLSEAKTQIGMTQWDNAAAALHGRFGAMRVIAGRTANHSRPEQTFVYGLELPKPDQLLAMLQGDKVSLEGSQRFDSEKIEVLEITPELGGKVQGWIDAGQRVHIVQWTPQAVRFHRSAS